MGNCVCGKPIVKNDATRVIDDQGSAWHGVCYVSAERLKAKTNLLNRIVKGEEQVHVNNMVVEAYGNCVVWAYHCWVEANENSFIIDLGGNIIFAYQNARVNGLNIASVLFVEGTLYVNRDVKVKKIKRFQHILEIGKGKK